MRQDLSGAPRHFDALADAIDEFLPLFNGKFASIFPAAGKKARPLTKSQVGALMLVRNGRYATATELGAALNLTKAGLTGIVDALVAKGLVERSADPADRRRVRLALTESGMRTAGAVMRTLREGIAARTGGLSVAERTALERHLRSAAAILRRID